MYKKVCLISGCFLGCICNLAFAVNTWTITQIQIDGDPVIGSQSCALAMRSDKTWPVVSYTTGPQGRTAALTPVGWQAGPVVQPLNNYGVSGATSFDGTIAFAYNYNPIVMLGKNGWTTSDYSSGIDMRANGPSIAFKNNNPAVLYMGGPDGTEGPGLKLAAFNGSGWSQDKLSNTQYPSFQSQAFGLAFDSYSQANVAFVNGSQLMYGLKGDLTQNQWSFSSIDQYNIHPDQYYIDVAMAGGDVPWIAYTQQNSLRYATYNIQQQGWVSGIIGQTAGISQTNFFSMTSDGRGGVGIAYIGLNNMLTFAYNDGSGFWAYENSIAKASNYCGVALEFDGQNRPVICYADNSGRLCLAYDSVAIPEPASAAIIAMGSALIASRRKFVSRSRVR
jgi:hypothetical protein